MDMEQTGENSSGKGREAGVKVWEAGVKGTGSRRVRPPALPPPPPPQLCWSLITVNRKAFSW